MTVQSARLVGFIASGAVAAGLTVAPIAGTATAASDDPVFHPVSADAVAPTLRRAAGSSAKTAGASTAAVAKRGVKKSKGEQILQDRRGIQGVGSQGLAVATGAKHVLEAGSFDDGSTVFGAIRAYLKKSGKQSKSATLNQFFGIKAAQAEISQPALAYDPVGKRFIAVGITDDAGDVGLVMRVSKSKAALPFGNKKWHKPVRFSESTSAIGADTDTEANPQVGVTSNKIAITATTDNVDPNRIYMFPKGPYYKGNDPGAWAANVNTTYDGQSPAINASKQANAFIVIPDTGDVTATTYTGKAKSSPPVFSKNVVYPTAGKGNLTTPPTVVQGGAGSDLDLGGLAFTNAVWRGGELWAATTVNCGGNACVRVFGIGTANGVVLLADEKLKATGKDWFSPALAVDGAGYVHLVATDVGSEAGPSMAVFARTGKGNKGWTAPLLVRKGNGPALQGPLVSDWWKSNAAAIDPTSPWDVWVAGAAGANGVPDTQLTSRVARISLAKNQATLKTSTNSVNKGSKVTFKAKLSRPGGDVIKGLPIALQKKPVNGGTWKTIKSGKTSAKGKKVWKVKVKKPARYRTLGKAKQQQNGQGKVFDKATSKAKRITLN